jgi:hypothetical protein
MNKFHHVESIAFTPSRMLLTVDGKRYSCAFADASERLARARDIERRTFEVSPAGYGIHWPLLDEDLTVDGLIRLSKPLPKESLTYAKARREKPMLVADRHATYTAGKSRRQKKGGAAG